MPELSTPPRRSSARAQTRSMSSARNGSSVRLTRTPPRVTDSVHRRPGACPAGSTSAPLCWARCRTQEATAAAGRSPLVVTREPVTASGAAPPLVPTGSHGWEPTAGWCSAPAPHGSGKGEANSRAGPGQPRVKITVTVTLSCWLPGCTGTEAAARLAVEVANSGSGYGWAAGVSDMLTTGPSGRPSARAYAVAFAFASATALARAEASSVLVSDRLSDTPSITVAFPPARAAALIWLPAADRRRSVIVSCSLTWYPSGTP